jgi:hypothetical protein
VEKPAKSTFYAAFMKEPHSPGNRHRPEAKVGSINATLGTKNSILGKNKIKF